MLDRNEFREIFLNDTEMYKGLLEKRGISTIRHFGKLRFGKISPEEMRDLVVLDHIWKTGDSLMKISEKFYGDTRYWWVLGWFNKKPTDNHYSPGVLLHIPTPLEEVLYFFGRRED